MFKKTHNQSGFSIVEIMVVFVVINIGLMGIMSLVTQNIQVSSLNRYELIASHLAQEGIELVKNIRDENWINGIIWTGDSVSNNILQSPAYAIDKDNIYPSPDTIDHVDAGLKIDVNGFYNHSSGSQTAFSRLITVIDYDDHIEVESMVQWQERGQTRNYVTSVILYDWR